MANGGKSSGGAPSFVGWLVVVDAGGDLVGRIRCKGGGLAEAEAQVRIEMTDGMTPAVTLSPAYRLTSQLVSINGAPQRITSIQTIEAALDLGKKAALPLHVLLTSFGFLSELDDESRTLLGRKIDDIERIASAARSNILLAR